MGRHTMPDDFSGAQDEAGDDLTATGRRRRVDAGRRGVSVGVIAALVAVVLLVGGVILWRFFGNALSHRSAEAAKQCLQGTATISVAADPSIAEYVKTFAESYNEDASPVGDTCVKVAVTPADSATVLTGLAGTWPAGLGERPALWIPASSAPATRLQAVAGKQIVSDLRSLVTSPLALAVRPQLKNALGQQGWAALPGLQTNPAGLDGLNLPGWGGLRLSVPTVGAGDAGYLLAEAVAVASAAPGAPSTDGLAAVTSLLAAQPQLANTTTDAAWDALTAPGDPAAAPVHAVAITEQQLYQRTSPLPAERGAVATWIADGPSAVADYPTVLLSGKWLSEEQVSGASEFARFMRKPAQLDALLQAGFRVDGKAREGNDSVGFAPLSAPMPAGDDAQRAAIAAAVTPAGVATTTVLLNEGLTGDEGGKPRLLNVTAALRDRISALPADASVGLWTFNKVDSGAAVQTGPLGEQLGPQPRSAALTGVLNSTTPTSGGGVSFTTVRAALADAVANYRPGQPNSILVITQGPHTDQTLDAQGLQDAVRGALDPNRPVVINVIDFGGDPDKPTWEAVAKLSGGGYQEIATSDSPDLAAAITRWVP
ncbi:hypothetical protein [Mycolicibacterium sp.]|uniref:hypothetical protein n=1 Tax=Mycolicibacterium sp. TaxID=2320850 RepID=UPI0025E77E3E|nr:hypothetical protein [Mycolicibacterium sp.]